MRVLLGLGGMELPKTRVGQDIRKHAARQVLGERHRCRDRRVVLSQADEVDVRDARTRKAGEVRIDERPGDLAGAIGSEVEEDDCIAVLDAHARLTGRRHEDRFHELVGHAARVRGPDGVDRVSAHGRFCLHDRTPRALDPLPSVVAIHRVVAAHDAGDGTNTDFREDAFEPLDVLGSRLGRHVPAVEEAVDVDPLSASARGHADQCVEMLLVAVDPSIGNETHEVHGSAGGDRGIEGLRQDFVLVQTAVRYGEVDTCQLLEHDAPGTDVQVPHLGVPHLPLRQTHGKSRAAKLGRRPV